MKFGLLIDFHSPHCNFGDYIQTIAIEYLYELIGIDSGDIVYLTGSDLADYSGEQILLPYNYVLAPLVDSKTGNASISKCITPVFLGASVEFALLANSYPLENFYNEQKGWMDLFRKYSPIGCRDEFTHKFLTAHGIPCYLQGCITNIFPRRKDGQYEKILLIDCPSEVLPYIPKDMLEKCESLSNAEYIDCKEQIEKYQYIKERYNYFRDNVALVVSTRYHIVTPCNAMGIPAVFAMRTFDKHSEDIRLDTLNPNVQLVTSNEYNMINWDPEWNDFPDIKKQITDLAIARIIEAYIRNTGDDKNYEICSFSRIWRQSK